MQKTDKYYAVNIRRLLEAEDIKLGAVALKEYISGFSCPINIEVERFLKERAIDFSKKHQAVTYLVLSQEDDTLAGYFSITIKPLVVNAELFSNTMKRKLSRFSNINQEDQTYNMSAYLIAQLGKNFNVSAADRIRGQELLEIAIGQLRAVQYEIGGMVTFVEAENKEKLLDFYEKYGYKRFATRQTLSDEPHQLIQLLKLI